MKKQIIFVVFILSLFLINFVSAEMLVSDAGVSYDSKILDYFNNRTLVDELSSKPLIEHQIYYNNSFEIINNKTFVAVGIRMRDTSDVEKFISSFSENELKEGFISPTYPSLISAKVTKEGFDKLISDSRVENIFFNRPVMGLGGGFKTYGQILKIFLILIIILIIIIYIIIYITKRLTKERKK